MVNKLLMTRSIAIYLLIFAIFSAPSVAHYATGAEKYGRFWWKTEAVVKREPQARLKN